MSEQFKQRLAALEASEASGLAGGLKGVEKEALRVDAEGSLARTPHPTGLGSALTNGFITTDFSEALLEFVTPAVQGTWEALQTLCDIHQFTYQQLGDELLWGTSMPCRLPDADDIPLARYGTSNVATMKTVYRRGLGLRYGRPMQTIAGIHFNYSLPLNFWPQYREILGSELSEDEFRSQQYLGLVRNFRRLGWLTLYLFGASPALCKSFVDPDQIDLPALNNKTWFAPFGTSLRMSDLGYSNQNQSRISISVNALDDYIHDLDAAIRTPEPDYEAFGVRVGDNWQQLNANLLQIENEYYSSVRPKRVANSGERPTAALRRGGIQYVEIRSLDINPSDPAGISQPTMRFIEALLLYCLLEDSPPLDAASLAECQFNQTETARRGRDPDFRLRRNGREVRLAEWAGEIIDNVARIAALIDTESDGGCYHAAARDMQALVEAPDATPSARLLTALRDENIGFLEYAFGIARNNRDYFANIAPMSRARAAELQTEATESIQRQEQIEASDNISFETYLERYFSQ